jgi:pilus assembly protein CpaC
VKPRISIIEHKLAFAITGARLSIATASILIATLSPLGLAQSASHPVSARGSIVQAVSSPSGMDSVSRVASDGKTLHVTVGHSIFVDTKTRLRRVYVADPTILNSVTLTPNEIVVTAMTPGISSLTLLDEAGQAQNYVVSADLDIDGLRQAKG